MKKGWVDRSDADDAEEARDMATERTRRSVVKPTKRRSPLYDKSVTADAAEGED